MILRQYRSPGLGQGMVSMPRFSHCSSLVVIPSEARNLHFCNISNDAGGVKDWVLCFCKLETHLSDSGMHWVPLDDLFLQPHGLGPVFIVVVAQPTRHLFGHVRSRCVIQTPLPLWGGG
jgi:hypothetical protein